jgi:hypothetical protein
VKNLPAAKIIRSLSSVNGLAAAIHYQYLFELVNLEFRF